MDTTRRSFLGGLAVASALSSTAAAQVVTPLPGEDSKLLALGMDFDAIHARFLQAEVALPAFQAAYRALAPEIPAVLISRHGGYAWSRGFTDYMADPTDPDYGNMKDANGTRLNVVHAYRIESQYGARFQKPLVDADFTNADETDMRLYATAQAYEVGVQSALISSGLGDALDQYRGAQESLRRSVWDLCAIRAKTPAGVALKIRATAAFAALGSDERLTASQLLSKAIWEDMGEDA